ncbi:MAG: hypothetical protein L3I99_04005 [Sulfurimonas sp.]|nr:hypothetical protein [Sulfurimonas sp.]
MKIYKRWLLYSNVFIVLIVFLITIFNYRIDSLGVFGNSNFLSKAAGSLTDGNMIAGLKNYDERLFQELIIKNMKVTNDIVVIGSSRTMQLRKRFFLDDNVNFFNHSVSGASMEDYISIIGAYESIKGYIPSTIILGIDPWAFNKYNNQSRWKTLEKYYSYEMNKVSKNNKIKVDTLNLAKWKQLINFSYTYSNMIFFLSTLKNNDKTFYYTDTLEIDDSIKEPDGSIHHPYKKRYPVEKRVKHKAMEFTQGNVYSLEKFDKLYNTKLFEDFINYIQAKEIKVIFLLSPYNPITYDILCKNKKYKNILAAEKYLVQFANDNKIELIGSYSPHTLNLTSKDFYDGMHANEGVMKKIATCITEI